MANDIELTRRSAVEGIANCDDDDTVVSLATRGLAAVLGSTTVADVSVVSLAACVVVVVGPTLFPTTGFGSEASHAVCNFGIVDAVDRLIDVVGGWAGALAVVDAIGWSTSVLGDSDGIVLTRIVFGADDIAVPAASFIVSDVLLAARVLDVAAAGSAGCTRLFVGGNFVERH
ncbi:hypothetical protein [Candidatus Phytoplasma fabacearum]|uniref:hypothetical protein n=1 Tax=Candidatus Phytoplasma fabacearum TaxID=2982628 RepID=UPI0030E80223